MDSVEDEIKDNKLLVYADNMDVYSKILTTLLEEIQLFDRPNTPADSSLFDYDEGDFETISNTFDPTSD